MSGSSLVLSKTKKSAVRIAPGRRMSTLLGREPAQRRSLGGVYQEERDACHEDQGPDVVDLPLRDLGNPS